MSTLFNKITFSNMQDVSGLDAAEWTAAGEVKEVLAVVQSSGPDEFPGLYTVSLPARPFAGDRVHCIQAAHALIVRLLLLMCVRLQSLPCMKAVCHHRPGGLEV